MALNAFSVSILSHSLFFAFNLFGFAFFYDHEAGEHFFYYFAKFKFEISGSVVKLPAMEAIFECIFIDSESLSCAIEI